MSAEWEDSFILTQAAEGKGEGIGYRLGCPEVGVLSGPIVLSGLSALCEILPLRIKASMVVWR